MKLISTAVGEEAAKSASLREAVARVKVYLSTHDVTTLDPSFDENGWMLLEATPTIIIELARLPDVSAVLPYGEALAVEHVTVDSPTMFVPGPGAPNGLNGAGEVVGIIDPGGCRLRSHVMLPNLSYTSTSADRTCSIDADCQKCGSGSTCVGGRCADQHGIAVASIIGQTMPSAKLIYYNSTASDTVTLDVFRNAYASFDKLNVKVVTQSFTTQNANVALRGSFGSKYQGIVEDDYARRHLFFVAQSAGNGDTVGPKNGENGEEACPFNYNALCVGSHNRSSQLSCFSSWRNFGHALYDDPKKWDDREEPDLLAFGGEFVPRGFNCTGRSTENILTASSTSSTSTTSGSGTSLSAPAAAAAAVGLRQFCRDKRGSVPTDLELRSF